MLTPLLDPDVADEAPTSPVLTEYDEECLLTYIRLLDAAAEDADWQEVAKIILHIDPSIGPDRAFGPWTHIYRSLDDGEWLSLSAGWWGGSLGIDGQFRIVSREEAKTPALLFYSILSQGSLELART